VLEDIPVGYQLINNDIENINPINETDFNNINFNSGTLFISLPRLLS
jgi:hypothetical protein